MPQGDTGNPQLCWDCKKACGGCSWSGKKHRPVPGWTAEEVEIKVTGHMMDKTWWISACPQFERDAWGAGQYRLDKKPQRPPAAWNRKKLGEPEGEGRYVRHSAGKTVILVACPFCGGSHYHHAPAAPVVRDFLSKCYRGKMSGLNKVYRVKCPGPDGTMPEEQVVGSGQ